MKGLFVNIESTRLRDRQKAAGEKASFSRLSGIQITLTVAKSEMKVITPYTPRTPIQSIMKPESADTMMDTHGSAKEYPSACARARRPAGQTRRFARARVRVRVRVGGGGTHRQFRVEVGVLLDLLRGEPVERDVAPDDRVHAEEHRDDQRHVAEAEARRPDGGVTCGGWRFACRGAARQFRGENHSLARDLGPGRKKRTRRSDEAQGNDVRPVVEPEHRQRVHHQPEERLDLPREVRPRQRALRVVALEPALLNSQRASERASE